MSLNEKRKFPIVKDTTPQTHAYITSRTLNFGGTSHETTDLVANSCFQRSELDWLIYNDPLSYTELILNGDPEEYLRTVTETPQLDLD